MRGGVIGGVRVYDLSSQRLFLQFRNFFRGQIALFLNSFLVVFHTFHDHFPYHGRQLVEEMSVHPT